MTPKDLFGKTLKRITSSLPDKWTGIKIAEACELLPQGLSNIYGGEYLPGSKTLKKILTTLPISDLDKGELLKTWILQRLLNAELDTDLIDIRPKAHKASEFFTIVDLSGDIELQDRLNLLAQAAVKRKVTRNVIFHLTEGIIARAEREGNLDFLEAAKDPASYNNHDHTDEANETEDPQKLAHTN